MHIKRDICIAVLALSSYFMEAQHKPRVWDTRDGLSNNWISNISQDDEGYIWLATQYGLNRFDGYSFENFTHDPEDKNSLAANWVTSIVRRSENELWLGVKYGGLDVFNIQQNKFVHQTILYQKDTISSVDKIVAVAKGDTYLAAGRGLFRKSAEKIEADKIYEGEVKNLLKSKDNKIFFLSDSGLYLYHPQKASYEKVFDNLKGVIQNIFIDSAGQLFALENNALLAFQNTNGNYTITKNLEIGTLESLRFADTPIIEDSENRIWIGGESGISIVNKNRNAIELYPYPDLFGKDITGIQALSFFEDKHKNMWIGTNKGLALISTFSTRFQSNDVPSISKEIKDIREFAEVSENLLLAANEGLFYSANGKRAKKILSEKIYGLHQSASGKLYGVGRGFFEIDTSTFNVKQLSSLYFKGSWSIAEDKNGNLWTINSENLTRYHKGSGKFETFFTNEIPTLKNIPRIDVLIDSNNRLWLCTLNSGVYILENPHDLREGDIPIFKNINYEEGNTNSLSNKITTSIIEASDGTIWIGTDTGLNAIDPTTFKVTRYLKKQGLKDEKIMALLEDDFGNIWGSTLGNSIFRLDVKTELFNFFGQEDGLNSSDFLLSSAYKNTKGQLIFGTGNGIEIINPDLFENFTKPKIDFFFTDAKFTAQSGEGEISSIDLSPDEFEVTHDNNSFSVNYTTLNYHLAEKTAYQYRVANLNDNWQSNGGKRSISFTGLLPGEYVLEVAASNPDVAFLSEAITLKIIVSHPWWQTNIAYFCYILLFLTLLFALYQYLLQRNLETVERTRLKELDTFKTTFFNNVAHELKTPLTIISGMANTIRKKGTKEIEHAAKTIIRNSNELNDMVNQILDLSKLEVGKLNLDPAYGDITVYLKYILSSFESLASAKEIRLHFLSSVEALEMDFDAQKIKYVFSNLISNAIKNTPVKGDIYMQITPSTAEVEITVKDNGKGISKEDLPLVFERYHQGKEQLGGTGIGLSFAKELIELMNGNISVESKIGQGANFRVTLPIIRKAIVRFELDAKSEEKSPIENEFQLGLGVSDESLPLIQIIEDNLDICSYLESILKQDYRLNFNHNGDSGLKNVFETIPDFVITDVMMPGKDGFEVCHEIKSNPITNHIPVIMLTAKSDAKSKLEGLKLGADVYLEKPFDEKELTIRIAKLLEQRDTLSTKYRNPDFWENKEPNVNDEFVRSVKDILEENIDNSSFGILELCRALGVSRSNLHRKLKALTGLSASIFIQTVRLQKAKQLLKTSEMNVSEVAYAVGFEDPAYFSRLFSKAFGHPPSETRKNL